MCVIKCVPLRHTSGTQKESGRTSFWLVSFRYRSTTVSVDFDWVARCWCPPIKISSLYPPPFPDVGVKEDFLVWEWIGNYCLHSQLLCFKVLYHTDYRWYTSSTFLHGVLEHNSIVSPPPPPPFLFQEKPFMVCSNFVWHFPAKWRYEKQSVTDNVEFHRKQAIKTKAYPLRLMLNDNESQCREL